MATAEQVIARWKANAVAAGVRLTDDDIARLSGVTGVGRVLLAEEQIARLDGWHATPDYLDKRLAEAEGGEGG